MAMHDDDSMAGLARAVLADTRQLIRDEIDLARAELREELLSARAGAIALGAAAVAAVLGVVLFSVALGGAMAYWLGWPAWSGYAMVSLLLLTGAYAAMRYGRKRLATVRALPNTRATLKENLTWIQSKSGPR